jgi:hypothetical protein
LAKDPLLYAVVSTALILIGTMALAFPIGIFSFFEPSLGGSTSASPINILPLIIFGVSSPIPLPFTANIGEFFLVSWAINLTLFVVALSGPWRGIIDSLKNIRRDKGLAIYANSGLTVAIIFPPVLLLAVFVEYILNISGVPVGSLPNTDPRSLFLLDVFAPLREEIGFRVTLVGVVCFLIAYNATRRLSSLRALWHPSRALSDAGVQVWRQPALYGIVVLSAVVFGAAHVLGGGWEIGKFFSAAIVGIVLAIVYFTHGFPAAVLLHWSFDYYQSSFAYFDQIRGLTDSSGNLIPSVAVYSTQLWISYLLLAAGVLTYIYFAAIFLRSLRGRKGSTFKPSQTTSVPVHNEVGSGGTDGVSGTSAEVQSCRSIF